MSKTPELTTVHDGTVTLRGTTFNVERITFTYDDGTENTETHLIGARGAAYLLRGFIERGGDSGIRELISLKSGAPWRKHGNAIRVIEIAGVIEEAK